MSKGNFIITRDWMMGELHLKGIALQVYGVIYSFSKDGKGVFNASIKWLAGLLGVDRKSINRAINKLIDNGYIYRQELNSVSGSTNLYTVNLAKIPNDDDDYEQDVAEDVVDDKNETFGTRLNELQGRTKCPTGEGQNAPRVGQNVLRGGTKCPPIINNKINNNSLSINAREKDKINQKANKDYIDFVNKYDIVIDAINGEFSDINFKQITKAYGKSKSFLQRRRYCRYLSWICKNYKKIADGYFEDCDEHQSQNRRYTPEQEEETRRLYGGNDNALFE